MKKLRITVGGKAYDVTVEVLGEEVQGLGAHMGAPLPPPGPRPPGAPAPAAGPVAGPPPAVAADPDLIRAPLAGTVQKIFVSEGAHVEEKSPVVLLDAMKMDTYIYASRSGTVEKIEVRPGDTVQVTDVLLRYRPGA
jgi:biotin carboxyl carrier protein